MLKTFFIIVHSPVIATKAHIDECIQVYVVMCVCLCVSRPTESFFQPLYLGNAWTNFNKTHLITRPSAQGESRRLQRHTGRPDGSSGRLSSCGAASNPHKLGIASLEACYWLCVRLWSNFNETRHSYSLPGPHDTEDIFKVNKVAKRLKR